jgi:hypothetical protein
MAVGRAGMSAGAGAGVAGGALAGGLAGIAIAGAIVAAAFVTVAVVAGVMVRTMERLVDAALAVDQALVGLSENMAQVSGPVAFARGERDVSLIQARLHQARQLEGQLSEYIRARTDTETAIISIKTALLQKLLPAVNTIADTVANLFTGIAEFSSYFLDELMKRFDQSVIASSLLALVERFTPDFIKSIIAIGRRARQAHAAWLSATIGKFLGGGFVNVLPGDFAEDVEGDKGGGGIFGNNNPPGNKFK